ncbi:cytidine deaminase [Bacteroidia bacterium]|nr:cytidine deaminase [Bacteroidia bacterium]MDC1395054.1 cytidine deaminase [Bacteroidia bacterium]
MKKTVNIEELKFSELPNDKQSFVTKAKEASLQSHAPYSEFHVGCSVLHQDGKIGLGSNQENASFPSGLCAERVALFDSAKNLSNNKVEEIAVYATSQKYKVPKMLVPCAGCLQVIADITTRQNSPIKIWMWDGAENVYVANNVAQFLPFHFELDKK